MTRLPRILLLPLTLFLASAAFADSADLSIAPLVSQFPDHRIEVLFALANVGPDVARNAIVTFEVPEGLTATVEYGYGAKPCDASQRPIRCELGDFHVGFPFHYGRITLRAPLANATYTLKMNVSSDTPDPNAANNAHTIGWETRLEADLSVLLVPQTVRIDPGERAEFIGNICNEVSANRPPTVRAEFTATGGAITAISPATGFTCRIEGANAVCTRAELPHGCPEEPFKFTVTASQDRRGGEARLTGRVFGDVPDFDSANDQDSKAVPVYRWITVDTVADDGAGSLRQSITDANAGCTPGPCRIVFEIPGPVPAEGWFTITPSSPLPSITAARVTLEGNRQTKFTGNTNGRGPEIAIDGRFAHRGIRMLALCEGVVDGLAIGNFDEDQGLWISTGGDCTGSRAVMDNHIGVDPSGLVPWPNMRGLRADFSENLIVTRNVFAHNRFSGMWMWRGTATISSNFIDQNGASGIYLGPEVFSATLISNVIRNHAEMGIAINRHADQVQMRRNLLRDNGGLGIDWGLDGVSPTDGDDHDKQSNAPVLLAAHYDPAMNATSITLTVKSTPLGPYVNFGKFEFFANEAPDGDGETFLGAADGDAKGETTTLSIPGDHRGKWINATWTREHLYGLRSPKEPKTDSHNGGLGVMTSELSNTVLVQ